MDRIRRTDLQPLLAPRKDLCVSLFLPLTPDTGRDSRQDAVRLRELSNQAEHALEKRGLRRPDAAALVAPVRALRDDMESWRHRGQGLAAFVSPGFFRVFHTTVPLPAAALVDHQFHIRPLLGLIAEDDHFFVLALSQNGVRLFEGDADELREVTVNGLPRDLADALKIEDTDRGEQVHSGMRGDLGKQSGVFHGQGGKPEAIKQEMREFLGRVASVIDRRLNGQQAPLVLATVEATVPIWRHASRYMFLLDDFVAGNPDRLTAVELHDKAWPIVQPTLARRQHLARQRLHEAAGSKVSFGLEKIVPAAIRAQIDSLFIDPGQTRWGRYNAEDDSVELHDQPLPGDQDLVELAAVETLRHKGDVFALERGNGGKGEVAEALLRF